MSIEGKMSIEEKIRMTNANRQRRNFQKNYEKAMAELAYEEWKLKQKRIEDRNAVIIMSIFIAVMLSLKFIF